jgi:hypothetical protein
VRLTQQASESKGTFFSLHFQDLDEDCLTWCVSESRGLFRGKVLHVVVKHLGCHDFYCMCHGDISPSLNVRIILATRMLWIDPPSLVKKGDG